MVRDITNDPVLGDCPGKNWASKTSACAVAAAIDCEKVQSIQLLHQTLCWASFSLAPMASERFGEQIGGGKWEK